MTPNELDRECQRVLDEMHVRVDAIQSASGTDGAEFSVKLWVPRLSRPLTVPLSSRDRAWRADRDSYLRERLRTALRRARALSVG